MSEWQPIKTLPRDGEVYLVTDARIDGGFPQVVYWHDDELKVPDASIAYLVKAFTHWMPISVPPEANQ